MNKKICILALLLVLLSLHSVYACDYYIDSCKTSGWESNKIYCLNRSISASGDCMVLDNHAVTLDCQGNNITGPNSDYGINSYDYDNITMRNCIVEDFMVGISNLVGVNAIIQNITANSNERYGIELDSDYSIIDGCTANSNAMYGIVIGSNYSNLTNSVANLNVDDGLYLSGGHNFIDNLTGNSNGDYGIYLTGNSVHNNTIQNSIFQENVRQDFLFWRPMQDLNCENTLTNVTGSGGRPIGFYHSNVSLSNQNFSMLYLCNADYSVLNNITINGSSSLSNNNLFLYNTDYSNFSEITSINNYNGIELRNSSNNLIDSCDIRNSSNLGSSGILVDADSNNNTIQNNDFNSNPINIHVVESSETKIINNTFYYGNYGIYFDVAVCSIVNNSIYYAENYGMYLLATGHLLVEGNTLISNAFGMYSQGGINTTIRDNNISNSDSYGMVLYEASNSLVEDNVVGSNNNGGIIISEGDNVTVKNNNLANNGGLNLAFSDHHSFGSNHFYAYDLNFTIADYYGEFNVTSVSDVPTIPSYYKNVSKFINISTSTLGAWIKINISYDDSGIAPENESTMSLYEYNGTDWVNLPNTSLDNISNIVSANISSFSTFAVMWDTIECGNNLKEPGEICDGSDLDGGTCAGEGFSGGTLSCLSDCSGYNTTNCTSPSAGSSKRTLVVSHKIICPDNEIEFNVSYRGHNVGDVRITLDNLTKITDDVGKARFSINEEGTYEVNFIKSGYKSIRDYYIDFKLCEEESTVKETKKSPEEIKSEVNEETKGKIEEIKKETEVEKEEGTEGEIEKEVKEEVNKEFLNFKVLWILLVLILALLFLILRERRKKKGEFIQKEGQ
ncbi:MAG: right-handed parallel beta-helix repeat-containing protein [Nanoarchaeota archaeon]|nr:right-handed parallel beta-helix repeat-containing protein [Nanoarchaeota archaeon]